MALGSPYLHSYRKKQDLPNHSKYLTMDCEMVGSITGESICARVVLLDWKGRTLLDTHVAPRQPVADYRTFVSGITAQHLAYAPSFEYVRDIVVILVRNKILIGHAIENDLMSLQITHPQHMIRDTAYYKPLQRRNYHGQMVPRKLKELALEKLGMTIQDPSKPHDPRQDALAALYLYKQQRGRWEASISNVLTEQERAIRMAERAHYEQQVLALQQQNHYYTNCYHNMMLNKRKQQQQPMQRQQQQQPMTGY